MAADGIAAGWGTPEVVEVMESEEALQNVKETTAELLHKVEKIEHWSIDVTECIATTNTPEGKACAEQRLKAIVQMLNSLLPGLDEAIDGCGDVCYDEIGRPLEGKEVDGASVLELLNSAHEDLKKAYNCVVDTYHELPKEGEMQNLCSHQRMKIWNYIHFQLGVMEALLQKVLDGRKNYKENLRAIKSADDDPYTWRPHCCKCKDRLRGHLEIDESYFKKRRHYSI